MITTIDSRPRRRRAFGALLGAVLARATSSVQGIRARQEAARAAHSLRSLGDHQLRDIGVSRAAMERTRGPSSPRTLYVHVEH